jgi:hypothetical protein
MATRSPWVSPRLTSPAATEPIRSAKLDQVTSRQPSSPGTASAGPSGVLSACSHTRVGTFSCGSTATGSTPLTWVRLIRPRYPGGTGSNHVQGVIVFSPPDTG